MRDGPRLQSVIEILTIHGEEKKPLDQICHTYFKSRRYIGSKDRHDIAGRVYGVTRHRGRCDWWAMESGVSPLLKSPYDAARIRVLSYLWLFEKVARDKIGILFSGEKYSPPRLSDDERLLFEKVPHTEFHLPWVEGDFPEWVFPFLKRRFGEELIPEMKALLLQAPVDLRVNILKATPQEARESLKVEGIETTPTPYSPWGLRKEDRVNISETQVYKNGLVEIQDEGSQIISEKVGVKPGDAVLDLCAGAGGKTLALAALMQNKGRIVATDTAAWRLQRAKERAKRAGAFNIEFRPLSNLQDKWLQRQTERFNHVLIDAPCSGSGTWRRNPDKKWTLTPQDIEELQALQLTLLKASAHLVKIEGRLVYATCSLFCEENEDVVQKFLSSFPNFKIVSSGLEGEKFLNLTPLRHHTDGFFAAILERIK